MNQVLQRVTSLSFDLRVISELANNTKDCLRSDLGELNYPIPNEIRKIIAELSHSEDFSYAPTLGDPQLLDAISLFDSKLFSCFKDAISLVTAGGQAALFAILSSVIKEGDAILTDSTYYPPYKNIAQLIDGNLIATDLTNLSTANLDKVKVLIINNPHNPTGKTYSLAVLKELALYAKKYEWIVIEDAVYNQIYFDKPTESIASFCPERTLIVNSVSKNFAIPGMRIGWIIGSPSIVYQIAKMHRNMISCPNSFFQKVLASYLPKSKLFLEELRIEMKQRRDIMVKIFDDLRWKYTVPNGSIYIFVKIPNLKDSFGFVENMIIHNGVSAMPGSLFGKHDDSLRFCYGSLTKEEIKLLGKRLQNFN